VSPNEAAAVLGVSPSATRDDVERAYAARLADAGPDVQRRDALTAARDALLAASAWHAQQGNPPQGNPPQGYPNQVNPQQPYPPQASGQQPGYPPPGYGQQNLPYPPSGAPAPWYPPAPARRRMSTGAIVGITVGSIAAGLVVLLVAVFAVVAIAHNSSRLAQAESSSSAAPFDDPSDIPSPDPSAGGPDDSGVADYDVDGVHIHYVDGWTFELTPGETCAGATVTAGFSDTPEGDVVDEWSTTLDLEAAVPYTLTIPDSASLHDYAGIDAVDCGQA